MITYSSLEKMGVKFFEAGFLDLHGVLRSRIFPVKRFDTIRENGFGFDGSSVGFAGIEESMNAPESFQKNTYELKEGECEGLGIEILPRNLKEAIDHAKNGIILKELLGERFNAFIKIKQKEWEDYCRHLDDSEIPHETKEVTEWERKRYFSM